MDCSPPGSSVHGTLQARILEWVGIRFSGESSRPRDWAQVSCIAGLFFTIWAILYQLRASLVGQLLKNLLAVRETWIWSWVGKIPWRRERLSTPVFWPGEFHGWYRPWGCKESDTTKWFSRHFTYWLSHKGSPSILEWVAYLISSRSSLPRNWTRVSCIAGRFLVED